MSFYFSKKNRSDFLGYPRNICLNIYENQKEIDDSPGTLVYTTTGYFTKEIIPFSLNKQFKSQKETEEFLKQLGSELPFISENGSVINGLNLLKKDLPQKLILN